MDWITNFARRPPMSRALFVGLDTVVREYLAVLSGGRPA